MNSRKIQSGFTLIELMVTLAIAAILFALALPAFDDFVRSNQRAAAVNQLMAATNLARAEALRRTSRVTICRTNQPANADPTTLDPECGNGPNGWEDGWIIFNDLNADNDWDTNEELISVTEAFSGDVIISGTGTTGTRISYNPSGELVPGVNNGTLTVCNTGDNGANSRDMVLAPIGRLRYEEATHSSCPPP